MRFRRSIQKFLPVLFLVATVAACEDAGKDSAQKAAGWMAMNGSALNLPEGWVFDGANPVGNEGAEMRVTVTVDKIVSDIRALPQMKRFAAIQVACPKKDAEIWSLLQDGQKLWIDVFNADNKSLARATCWRR